MGHLLIVLHMFILFYHLLKAIFHLEFLRLKWPCQVTPKIITLAMHCHFHPPREFTL